jgi:hypothetical protein
LAALELQRDRWLHNYSLLKMRAVVCLSFLVLCLSCSSTQAQDIAAYQDWRVQKTLNSVEAYTAPNANSSFGLYCIGDQCLFYLHDSLLCQPGSISPVLMSSVQSAASISMQCSLVGGKLFQILQPFTAVLNTLKANGVVSFALPLQAGTFGISSFSLAGSAEAIKRTLLEAAKTKENKDSKEQPAPQAPQKLTIPGSKKLQEINI